MTEGESVHRNPDGLVIFGGYPTWAVLLWGWGPPVLVRTAAWTPREVVGLDLAPQDGVSVLTILN